MGIKYDQFGNKIFEGKYINGMKNGFGKEYNYIGGILFEGVYLNGKRWIGSEHDFTKNLIYEIKEGKRYINNIEYKNKNLYYGEDGSFNKYIIKKEYYDNTVLEFEGEYLYEERNVYGKLHDKKGNLIYEGKFSYGKIFEGI